VRYRLIKPDWAKLPETEGGIPGPNSFDGDDFPIAFLKEKNAQGYGIYYFPNYNSKPVPKGEYTAGKHIDTFEWVYVDMDLKDGVYKTKEEFIAKLVNFPVLPTKVLTSGNGVHAYWRVSKLDRERFCELQLRLIKALTTDHSIWTVLRCMRLEGYFNTKRKDEYKLVEADVWSEGAYTYKDLDQHLPALDKSEEMKIVNHLRRIDGQEPEINLDEINVSEVPDRFKRLMEQDSKVKHLFTDTEGDRSKNAWALLNILYADFDRAEAVAIIANTPKALSKGAGNGTFAAEMVAKAYKMKAKFTVPSVAEKIKQNTNEKRKGRLVQGPDYFDCSYRGWRTQQVFGLIGGSGIGKSTTTLNIFEKVLQNNPDDICIYFNLEMTDAEVVEKFRDLTGDDEKLLDRLFVISNEDEDGNPLNINLQKIVWYCRDIQKSTGKRLVAIAIDHIGVINPSIDIRQKPTFGLEGDGESAFGDYRNVNLRKMPQLLKELAKQLDVFLIVQSQTTKAKGMDGDTPLGIDAAYGAAQFEQYMDYVMTIWQPLRRVHNETALRALGWQYAKIRSKHKNDEVETYTPSFLCVDVTTGRLTLPTDDEEQEFEVLNKKATVIRKKSEKKDEIQYKGTKGGVGKLKALLAVK
jgi:hypothetical protein